MSDFRTHTEINLLAIRQNAETIKRHTGKQLIAVVKADAYGHGVIPVVTTLYPVADMFAVATVEEGIELREAGIRKPILILFSCLPAQVKQIVEFNLTPSIWDGHETAPTSNSRPLRVNNFIEFDVPVANRVHHNTFNGMSVFVGFIVLE